MRRVGKLIGRESEKMLETPRLGFQNYAKLIHLPPGAYYVALSDYKMWVEYVYNKNRTNI
jgi:hypothetical protein